MKRFIRALVVLALMVAIAMPAALAEDGYVTAWGNYCSDLSQFYIPCAIDNQTFRIVTTLGISGESLTVELSNRHGAESLTIDHVSFAPVVEGTADEIVPESASDVLFGGAQAVTIPTGETAVSDPVSVPVEAGKSYAVTGYISAPVGAVSTGNAFNALTYICAETGDHTADSTMNAEASTVVPYLRAIHVLAASPDAQALVIVGDSTSSNEWPMMLQQRLAESLEGEVSVIPRATSGNRLMIDGSIGFFGEAVINRFEDDVFSTQGATAVLLKIGVNDIFQPVSSGTQAFPLEEMIEAEQKLIDTAHAQGLKVYMMTITPFNGYESRGYGNVWSEDLEQMRLDWNQWIMTTDSLDGYIDLCPILTDPEDSTKLIAEYTQDCLHPNEQGMELIANSVPLEWFAE